MSCYFEWKYGYKDKSEKLYAVGPQRIQTIIIYSKDYADGKHLELQKNIDNDASVQIQCHRGCVSTYTSKIHLKRVTKRSVSSELDEQDIKRARRSFSSEFNFLQHCLFCGEDCILIKDKKHPNRWRPAYLFRQLEYKSVKKSLKEVISTTCDERHDEWASQVKIRIQGAVSDLHAVDAMYHVDCRCRFMGQKAVDKAKHSSQFSGDDLDKPYMKLVDAIVLDETRIWNSVELHKLYAEYDGRKSLIQKLIQQFNGELLVLSSPGYANVIAFQTAASSILRLAPDEDGDLQNSIAKLSKQIKQETKQIATDREHYQTRLRLFDAERATSKSLMELFASLSPHLDQTPPALLMGNMVTGIMKHTPTDLQIGLGMKLRHSKDMIQLMHNFQVVCSHDEVLRFKKSAAHAATHDSELSGNIKDKTRFTQVVVDNFDADISSQNGKQSTHSLAMLVTQTGRTDNGSFESSDNKAQIKRIRKEDMPVPIEYDPVITRYHGPEKPPMPAITRLKSPLLLQVICQRLVSSNENFLFLKDATKDNCPEFNGYNTRLCRENGGTLKPSSSATYQPLIDMTPSHPDTMMTSLVEAQRLTRMTGQEITVFTCDQQLYRVALHVMWVYPERFSNLVLRLGGMHLLMSFVGSVGSLMANSGLEEIMGNVIAGGPKMLSGKKFPQNVRALRMVAEEILRSVLEAGSISSGNKLQLKLNNLSAESKTTKLWIDVLIKPVLIMMLYLRAEREGDWSLHLEAVKQMMPYFFAAGHTHYARYGLFYLKSTESFPIKIQEHFLAGDHVMRHIPGYWNGIWSDMWIESTFMRYGHGQGGIIGVTLRPETLKTWALSLHICTQLEEDVLRISQRNVETRQNKHKEENQTRIDSDAKDRENIRLQLQLFIDPMKPETHPEDLVNIVSSRVSSSAVNVHNAVSIGTKQMESFEGGWPNSFHETISKKIVTMDTAKKHINIGSIRVFDTSLIYSRVIGLQASSRDVDIKHVFSHELAPVPTSMFSDDGEMRVCKAKSTMKQILQEPVSSRHNDHQTTAMIIDGSALMWVIRWPECGTVLDYLLGFKANILSKLKVGDVYLVFDRYREYSTKDVTRQGRTTSASSRVNHMRVSTILPPQKVILTVTENKLALIKLISHDLLNDDDVLNIHTKEHKLVITGENNVPHEVFNGTISCRDDIATTHEEADDIIVQQAIKIAANGLYPVTVLADDTDVFILLLHFYYLQNIKVQVFMESPVQERTVIDIGASVSKNEPIILDLLAAHALSGCDTTASCFGIGKGKKLRH